MAKKFDPQAKAKRQKIFIAVGGVLLLGLLAFQVPRTMKMLHQSAPSSSSSSASTTATTPVSPTSSGTSVTAAVVSGGDGLTDPDALPAPQSGQLLAFGRFRTKDPFVQQLNTSGPSGASASAATAPSGSTQPAAASNSTGVTRLSAKAPGASTAPQRTVQVVASTAKISVNGTPQSVRVGRSFPSADPVFKLVSLTRTVARVGIAGGSLENGAATVALTKGKAVTLLNTADGTRYVLRLLSIS
jgi:hypothetical protein